MVENSTSSLSREMERNAKQAAVEKIHQDREGAPEDVGCLLELIESHLFEPTLDVQSLRPNAQNAETTWRFHSWLGTDPPLYLDRLRLDTACRLLTNTEASVADIATSLGFEDASLFTKWFKRRRGQSPLEVRGEKLKPNAIADAASRPLEVGGLLDKAAAGKSHNALMTTLPCIARRALLGILSPADTTLVLYFIKWRNGKRGRR